jgi:hypothetical protein
VSYATLAQIRPYLKLGPEETADDTLLAALSARAQQFIETHTGRTFEAAADTERHFDAVRDVEGSTLWLGQDLSQITTITNGDSDEIEAGEYITIPAGDTPYYGIRLKASSGKSWTYEDDPEDAIVVEGRWAYSVTAPLDVVQACIRLTVWFYRQKDTSADVDRPLLTGDGVTVMPMAMPRDILQLVAPYVKKV